MQALTESAKGKENEDQEKWREQEQWKETRMQMNGPRRERGRKSRNEKAKLA